MTMREPEPGPPEPDSPGSRASGAVAPGSLVRPVTAAARISDDRARLRPVRRIPRPRDRRGLTADTGADVGVPPPPNRFDARRLDPRRWSLWQAPARVIVAVLAVDLVALVLGIAIAAHTRAVGPAELQMLGLLVLGCAIHIEAARGIERRREVVPLSLALALVVFSFAYWWLRISRRPVPHRWTYSCATVVIASVITWTVLGLHPGGLLTMLSGPVGLGLVVAAMLVRWTVNHGLVVGMIKLSAPERPWREVVGSPTDILIGLGALALGTALAVLALTAPWLLPVLLLPVMGMHRGFLLQQFARAARTDPKTGLLNAPAWRDQAERELARLRRRGGRLGVIMVDLDAFKGINDRHGHLVGDAVLLAVAETLRAEVRPYDIVGRFGGEEFVVLVAEADPEQVGRTAERLRARISECQVEIAATLGGGTVCGLTASIGTAAYPYSSGDLEGLLLQADTALYAAKDGGRNRVVGAPPYPPAY